MLRAFDWFQLGALGCLACLGIGRGLQLRARGIRVLPPTAGRPVGRVLVEKTFGLCFLVWVYEIVAHAWPLPFHPVPAILDTVVVDATPARMLGAVLVVGALVIYGTAVIQLGDSWRLFIDADAPGLLVTTGIFARSRNPIYVSLELYAFGTFLLAGALGFLLFAFGLAGYLHRQIRQEERFLEGTFGVAFQEYCARVGRYITW